MDWPDLARPGLVRLEESTRQAVNESHGPNTGRVVLVNCCGSTQLKARETTAPPGRIWTPICGIYVDGIYLLLLTEEIGEEILNHCLTA